MENYNVFVFVIPDGLSAEITFKDITRNSFRVIFPDPPPNLDDPTGRQILFYVISLQEEGAEVETVTINAVEGADYHFLELQPGTNYSVEVNFLAGLPDGSQVELILSDLPLQYVSTSTTTDAPGMVSVFCFYLSEVILVTFIEAICNRKRIL